MFACRRHLARANATLLVSAAVIAGVAGCASQPSAMVGHAAGTGEPSWARALGGGVVIINPTARKVGNGSPDAVVQGVLEAIEADKPAAVCAYLPPPFQPECMATSARAPDNTKVSVSHFALGYAAVRGDEALVGTTGRFCASDAQPACASNANPAALLSRGKTFAPG
jgi:hypothetical protein